MIPVILTTQSVLGFLQGQEWAFQPYATNSPTGWTSSPLPSGLTLDGTTGELSGAVSAPGVYVIGLTASNGDGASTPVLFTVGIEASAISPGADIDAEWDIVSGVVQLQKAVPPEGVGNTAGQSYLFAAKYLSDVILNLRITKAGATLDLGDPSELKWTLSEVAGDGFVVESDGFAKTGDGSNSRYRVHMKLLADLLFAALSNYDPAKGFAAQGELELVYNNPDAETFGEETLRVGSGTFLVQLAPNLT